MLGCWGFHRSFAPRAEAVPSAPPQHRGLRPPTHAVRPPHRRPDGHHLHPIRKPEGPLTRQVRCHCTTSLPTAAGPPCSRAPDWNLAEAGIGIPTTEVHPGDCWARGRSLVTVSAERARAEPAGGTQPYAVCRPDRLKHCRLRWCGRGLRL
ncbi:DUF6233 domain-containing protein [Streptomyces sp. KL115B]|uniref:DUF6233 domain-containing protein n=1 Tax=Streptomyces sp. KL115B TaxID=3045154 RepID=UPI003532134A